jgi:hypothetical protein
MCRNPLWVVLLCLLMGVADAQTPLPTTTYKLHAEKEEHSPNLPSTLIYLLHNQALLVLIPQSNDKWTLKRISGWDAGTPREETLSFTGDPLQEGASAWDNIKVDPSSNYAVIRLQSFLGGSLSGVGERSAVVVLVDLRSFTIVSKQTTTDPLLAASNWSFAKNGLLIARAMTDRVRVPPHPKPEWSYDSLTDTYENGAFTLPDWKLSMNCRYEYIADGKDAGKHHLGKVDDSCAALVELAGVPSVENLPDGPPKPIPHAALAGPTCQTASDNVTAGFALYGCRTGHDYMDGEISTTSSRDLTVLTVSDSKVVLRVPLPHNFNPYPAVLANANGHAWLLLLRDGIKLEIYRLP